MSRLKPYRKWTEEGYAQWHKRYVIFNSQVTGRMRHPKEMGAAEVTAVRGGRICLAVTGRPRGGGSGGA